MNKWIAEFELEDGDTMPEHMDLEYKGARIDFHCKPLKQEPTTKNGILNRSIIYGDDCISRQAVIDMTGLSEWFDSSDSYNEFVFALSELPSVTPIRPKGHWIEYSWNDNGLARWGLECDQCHKKYKYGGEIWNNPNFCPNCGADMREVEE